MKVRIVAPASHLHRVIWYGYLPTPIHEEGFGFGPAEVKYEDLGVSWTKGEGTFSSAYVRPWTSVIRI